MVGRTYLELFHRELMDLITEKKKHKKKKKLILYTQTYLAHFNVFENLTQCARFCVFALQPYQQYNVRQSLRCQLKFYVLMSAKEIL